ncbi:hypothetical protein [Cellvibrio mixtus]|uniref:hypothetical protein n=1 Tax=Cellvibrio mixtus TaxID=39650 RepID=UPI00058775B7|nr:hypothetical protein [Cellvibrio mixtus]
MGAKFWVKRFFVVLCGAFIIICGAQILKGNSLSYSINQGGMWAFISASVFTISRIYQAGRGQYCAICKDTPEVKK